MHNTHSITTLAEFFVFLLGIIVVSNILALTYTSIHPPSVTELSPAEIKNYQTRLMNMIEEHDPTVALSFLREEVAEKPAVAHECHLLSHAIGHAAYDKYHDFSQAMSYQQEVCNSGYLHGVLEKYFLEEPDTKKALLSACQNSTEDFWAWECYHGTGHGVMFATRNDLPRALELCGEHATDFGRQSCVNGVFMENFNAQKKLHPSAYLSRDNPAYPCDTLEEKYKADCYLYAPTYFLEIYKDDYKRAFHWCSYDIPKDYTNSCVLGVGGEIMEDHISSPKAAERLCMSAPKAEREICLRGAVNLLINFHHGLREAEEFCTMLKSQNQRLCAEVVESKKSWFP